MTNVKVDPGVPSTEDLAVEPGSIQESVVVASGAEIIQTQTAAITNTVIGRQITETPIASRNAHRLNSPNTWNYIEISD